jgi:5'-3' exonuclease
MAVALIDSDTPIFAAALSAEGKEDWVAFSRLDSSIRQIIADSGCDGYKLFVSGKENFRHAIDPKYKANRTGVDPEHRKACRQHLIDKWGAVEATGMEADDLCGIYQTENTIICGIDKDLLQIPGKHYQWPIVRGGKCVREGRFINVSPIEGLRAFYTQLLVGDTSDNIIGISGIGPKKAEKWLETCETEEEMKEVVSSLYNDNDRFYNNANLLWILRDEGVTYSIREEMHESN